MFLIQVLLKLFQKKKIDMPEVLIKLRDRSKKIIIFPVYEEWSDLGIMKDLRTEQNKKK